MQTSKVRTGLSAAIHKLLDPVYDARRAARISAAAAWRRQNGGITFVGVTGSHGKSTATSLLGAILQTAAPTVIGSPDNHLRDTVRTVLSARPWRDRFCIQEISAFPLGAINSIIDVLQPEVGIVTAIGGDHRKEFRSFEGAATEKARLVHCLPRDGLAVLNRDDPLVAAMAGACACRVVWHGRSNCADLRLLDATSIWPDRLTMEVAYRGERFTVHTQLVGAHWRVSVLAALLAALELGIPRDDCLAAIADFKPLFTKMSVHPAPGGACYVLDTAKLSYHGMEACLEFLRDARAPRRTVLLGTLSDYSGASRTHYERVARLALAVAERVVFTGPNAMRPRKLTEEFGDRLLLIESRPDAAKRLSENLLPGEIVYIKAPLGDRLRYAFPVNGPT